MQKTKMRPGTNIDLSLCYYARCFACKKYRWGLGPILTRHSGTTHAVLHAPIHRWGLGPIETSNFGAKQAVLFAQIHRWGLGPIQTCNSGPKDDVLHEQNHRWGLGPIETSKSGPKAAVLHAKDTDEAWDQYRLVIVLLRTLFCLQKVQMRAGTHIDSSFWHYTRCFACTNPQMRAGTHWD